MFKKFICLFLIALRIWFHHRFLVLLLYVRFDQVGNKLQQPFRNQRNKFTWYAKCQHYVQYFLSCPYYFDGHLTKNISYHVSLLGTIFGYVHPCWLNFVDVSGYYKLITLPRCKRKQVIKYKLFRRSFLKYYFIINANLAIIILHFLTS